MQLSNSFKNMALLAMLACAAQAPGAAAFSVNSLSKARAFTGKLDNHLLSSLLWINDCCLRLTVPQTMSFLDLVRDEGNEKVNPMASSL
jgi:hypothetical protein